MAKAQNDEFCDSPTTWGKRVEGQCLAEDVFRRDLFEKALLRKPGNASLFTSDHERGASAKSFGGVIRVAHRSRGDAVDECLLHTWNGQTDCSSGWLHWVDQQPTVLESTGKKDA